MDEKRDERLDINGNQQRLKSELYIVDLLSRRGRDDQPLTFESTQAINTLHKEENYQ